MSILFTCPHCRAHKTHHEPVSDRVNVRACPECRRLFYLWWMQKEARIFGVEPVSSNIMLGYPGTQSERFARGGFTSDDGKTWSTHNIKITFP